jgi:hypothetical protein
MSSYHKILMSFLIFDSFIITYLYIRINTPSVEKYPLQLNPCLTNWTWKLYQSLELSLAESFVRFVDTSLGCEVRPFN